MIFKKWIKNILIYFKMQEKQNLIEQTKDIKILWFDEKIKNDENQNYIKQLQSFFYFLLLKLSGKILNLELFFLLKSHRNKLYYINPYEYNNQNLFLYC